MNEKREVTTLRKQVKCLKRALEFYADIKNYGHDGESDSGEIARLSIQRYIEIGTQQGELK